MSKGFYVVSIKNNNNEWTMLAICDNKDQVEALRGSIVKAYETKAVYITGFADSKNIQEEVYVVLIKDKNRDCKWEELFTCYTYEQAEKVIEAHFQEYAAFKIEKVFKGAKYEA